MSDYVIYIFLEKMTKLFAKSGDPDQNAASDMGLHFSPITLFGGLRIKMG